MDQQDRPDEQRPGAECGACGGVVTGDGIRLLAEREDLAFVAVACDVCGSESLAIFLGARGDEPAAAGPGTDALSLADVAAMQAFLAGYDGDLRGLFDRPEPA